VRVELREDEWEYLASGRTDRSHINRDNPTAQPIFILRCEACGHLEALHNGHCCVFCMVPGCPCEWGKVKKEKKR
jgi:hypothetical protein